MLINKPVTRWPPSDGSGDMDDLYLLCGLGSHYIISCPTKNILHGQFFPVVRKSTTELVVTIKPNLRKVNSAEITIEVTRNLGI